MENQQPRMIPVDVNLLQAIVDYMQTKPYQEVHQFIDILTGKVQPVQPEIEEYTQGENQ